MDIKVSSAVDHPRLLSCRRPCPLRATTGSSSFAAPSSPPADALSKASCGAGEGAAQFWGPAAQPAVLFLSEPFRSFRWPISTWPMGTFAPSRSMELRTAGERDSWETVTIAGRPSRQSGSRVQSSGGVSGSRPLTHARSPWITGCIAGVRSSAITGNWVFRSPGNFGYRRWPQSSPPLYDISMGRNQCGIGPMSAVCWGQWYNGVTWGQGPGPEFPRLGGYPVQLVETANFTLLALSVTGHLWFWGQPVDGGWSLSPEPVQVGPPVPWLDMAVGGGDAYSILRADSTVYRWTRFTSGYPSYSTNGFVVS